MNSNNENKTLSEEYLTDVIDPKLDSLSQQVESLQNDQKSMLDTLSKEQEKALEKIEELSKTKAAGPAVNLIKKDDLDKSVKAAFTEIVAPFNRAYDILTKAYNKMSSDNATAVKLAEGKRRRIEINIGNKSLGGLLALVLVAAIVFFGIQQHHINGSAEAWANRAYNAAVELDEVAPGNYYHDTVQSFRSDHKDEAKETVRKLESLGKTYSTKKKNYSASISHFLQNIAPDGVVVDTFIECSNGSGDDVLALFRYCNDKKNGIGYHSAYISNGIISIADCALRNFDEVDNLPPRKWVYQGKLTIPIAK